MPLAAVVVALALGAAPAVAVLLGWQGLLLWLRLLVLLWLLLWLGLLVLLWSLVWLL